MCTRKRCERSNFTLDELQEVDESRLEELGEIGSKVATSTRTFFENERNRETLERLHDTGVRPCRVETGAAFEETKFVFTGKLDGYTREGISDQIERYSANVTSSVPSETDYLVVGENPGKTKRGAAEEQNVEQLSTDEFHEQLLSKLE